MHSNSHEMGDKLMDKISKKYFQKLPTIPTLPIIAQEILMLVEDDFVTINKIKGIIENDPAISVRILTLANSAYYGFGGNVKTLRDAIFRIGFNNVRYLAVGISLITLFEETKNEKAARYEKIFIHSIATGFTTKFLAGKLSLHISDDILVMSILHDIGLLMMNRYLFEEYQKVHNLLNSSGDLLEAEKDVFGFTHPELGQWLAEEWNLPKSISNIILYHHQPSRAHEDLRHVAIVHIADYLASKHIMRTTPEDIGYACDSYALSLLDISEDDLEVFDVQIKSYSENRLSLSNMLMNPFAG